MQSHEPSPPPRPFAVTNRLVLSIAVPMTLAYMTTPLIGLVDTAVVGQFGDAALIGGLAAGAIIFDVVFSTFNFLRAGTTGLVAQAQGRGDDAGERTVFWRAFAVALLAGAVLVLAAPLVILAGGRFLAAGPEVTDAMAVYVGIRALSAPFALGNYALLGYFLGRGEATLGLGLQVLLNGTNIALSILFGLSLGWGVAGVAWATVAAEAVATAAGLLIVLRRFGRQPRLPRGMLFELAPFLRMMAVNGDIMIRSFVLLGAFALLARQGAQIGTVTLAANAILMNLFLAAAYFLDGFAAAAEQLAGRAVGARDARAFARTVRLTAIWGFLLAGVSAVFLLFFGEAIVAGLTTAEDVRAAAMRYLPWAALTALSGVLAFQMDGVFIGATWTRDMRNMMLLSFALYLAALLGLGARFGNHGLWAALHVFLIARGVSLAALVPSRARRAFQEGG